MADERSRLTGRGGGGGYRLGTGTEDGSYNLSNVVINNQNGNVDTGFVSRVIISLTLLTPILFASMFASVGPLEIGLLSNDWTSYVDTEQVYLPGRYMVGWGKSFVTFPGTQINMIFSDNHAKGIRPDAGPILTRTGDDKGELDSGGQPITISLSLQYKLPQNIHLGGIYSSFGMGYHQRYLLLTRNVVSNIAQEFSPLDFWQRREDVSDAMLAAVKTSLKAQGGVEVIRLQLLRIDFPDQYEDMITKIQLQVQAKATKEYEQQVMSIVNDLSVLTAENAASIAVIGAEAERKSLTITNEAKAQGMVLLQAARANATKHVAETLALSGSETVQYLKIQAIKAHPADHTTVGLEDPFPSSSEKS